MHKNPVIKPHELPKDYKLWKWNGYIKAAPKDWQDHHIKLIEAANARTPKAKFDFFKGWVEEHWPEPIFIWDRWSDLFFAAACGWREKIEELTGYKIEVEHEWWRYVLATGTASSGKTKRVAMWFLFMIVPRCSFQLMFEYPSR